MHEACFAINVQCRLARYHGDSGGRSLPRHRPRREARTLASPADDPGATIDSLCRGHPRQCARLWTCPHPDKYLWATTLWVDTERVELAAFAPNWQLSPDRQVLELELDSLGKDCTERDRLYALADDSGILYAKGVRTVRSSSWAGSWDWRGAEAQRQICHAGFVDRLEVQLDDLFTIAWEWRVPTKSWRQHPFTPCDVVPADATPGRYGDGYVDTELPSDRTLRCGASGARYRLWLNPRLSNVLLGQAKGPYPRMGSVEEFATTAACEGARVALLQAVKKMAPRNDRVKVPATHKAWLVGPRGVSAPTAYVQEVTCEIAGRTFAVTQRFALRE